MSSVQVRLVALFPATDYRLASQDEVLRGIECRWRSPALIRRAIHTDTSSATTKVGSPGTKYCLGKD